jgi:hypothetical protein
MSKNKLLYLISERSFETMQRLAIIAYNHHKEKTLFCFESYFELSYKNIIQYSLEYLKISDIELFKNIFYKYFKEIYNISVNCGIYTSNRKLIFAYWV